MLRKSLAQKSMIRMCCCMMDTRKKKILEAAITHYIGTAEPVSSKVLSEKYRFDVRSATIRNELNDLEKEGYLSQLHASSGRIPTDKGYRLFVDQLKPGNLQGDQAKLMKQTLQLAGYGVEQTLVQVSTVLSSLINYTTIVLTPNIYQETLKIAHLILVDLDRILVVLLNTAGINAEFFVHIQDRVDQEDLNRVSQLLTKKLGGKSMTSLTDEWWLSLMQELPDLKGMLKNLGESIYQLVQQQTKKDQFFTRGFSNMIQLPEFRNIELTQKVLTALEENKVLVAVLNEALRLPESKVSIGGEFFDHNLQECGLVASSYKIDDEPIGVIGVLGPKRMDYSVVVPMIQHVTKMVGDYLSSAHFKKRGG